MLLELIAANVKDAPVVHAGKAIALALGIGAGAAGAGAGIGNIFGSMIQSVARQPELPRHLGKLAPEIAEHARRRVLALTGMERACCPEGPPRLQELPHLEGRHRDHEPG